MSSSININHQRNQIRIKLNRISVEFKYDFNDNDSMMDLFFKTLIVRVVCIFIRLCLFNFVFQYKEDKYFGF
jgi:hypothetical protein